jgi:3D (Asp-Asp-Asp) domain-containing protein
VYWAWIAFPIDHDRYGWEQKQGLCHQPCGLDSMKIGKGSVMAKKSTISCGSRKRLISVAVGLIIAGVILTSLVFPRIVSAGRPIVSLQATLLANLPENPIASKQQDRYDTVQEQHLIASLMKDVVVKTDYEKLEESGHWQMVRMRVTGYCPCSKCCGVFSDGITANNHHIQPGNTFVAADKSYRFGTEMVIPGYNDSKSVQVTDRGGAIKGNRLDIFFHSHQQALQWGVQYLDVLVKIE